MSKTTAKKAPARKPDLMKYLPAAILLIGLIIMTVCFFSVSSQLNAANAQLSQVQSALNAAAGEAENAATDVGAEITRLQTELEATAAELAEKIAADEVSQAEIARLEAVVAEQQVQLDIASTALIEAMEYLSQILPDAE